MSLDTRFLYSSYSSPSSGTLAYSKATNTGISKKIPKRNGKKLIKTVVIVLVLGGLVVMARSFIRGFFRFQQQNKSSSQTSATGTELGVETQTQDVNRIFTFPGLDETGKEKGELQLKITTVEKTNQVLVQDKTYTAKNDKLFLIVNLELKNDSTDRLNIFPGDLIRLVVNGNEEKKFAPDLHNNYVLVAPISTKIDRIGFVIDQDLNKFTLQVGELEEDKALIEIKFPS